MLNDKLEKVLQIYGGPSAFSGLLSQMVLTDTYDKFLDGVGNLKHPESAGPEHIYDVFKVIGSALGALTQLLELLPCPVFAPAVAALSSTEWVELKDMPDALVRCEQSLQVLRELLSVVKVQGGLSDVYKPAIITALNVVDKLLSLKLPLLAMQIKAVHRLNELNA